MNIIRKISGIILLLFGIIFVVSAIFTENLLQTIIGFLFFVLYDNHLTHDKLRNLEATVLATGMVTTLMITKGKPNGDTPD